VAVEAPTVELTVNNEGQFGMFALEGGKTSHLKWENLCPIGKASRVSPSVSIMHLIVLR
jgi:hypothetical protein